MEIKITRTYADVLVLYVDAPSLEEAQRLEHEGAYDNETWVADDGWLTSVVYKNIETGEEFHA